MPWWVCAESTPAAHKYLLEGLKIAYKTVLEAFVDSIRATHLLHYSRFLAMEIACFSWWSPGSELRDLNLGRWVHLPHHPHLPLYLISKTKVDFWVWMVGFLCVLAGWAGIVSNKYIEGDRCVQCREVRWEDSPVCVRRMAFLWLRWRLHRHPVIFPSSFGLIIFYHTVLLLWVESVKLWIYHSVWRYKVRNKVFSHSGLI